MYQQTVITLNKILHFNSVYFKFGNKIQAISYIGNK